MARGFTKRVVLHRQAVDQVTLAMADGMFAVGKAIIENARPPDLPPLGKGLLEGGGVLAYVDGKKVNGWSQGGKQPKPPRAARVSKGRGAVVIVGWGFPARLVELGSIHNTPNPFFTPSVDETLPRAQSIMAPVVSAALPRKP